MNKFKLLSGLLICFGIPVLLHALPQDLDTFFDFENITAEGSDFTIGQSPFTVRVINFTLETVENPSLTHSGTKALVLVPGAQEGKILFERGATLSNFMQRRLMDPVDSSCVIKTFSLWLNKD